MQLTSPRESVRGEISHLAVEFSLMTRVNHRLSRVWVVHAQFCGGRIERAHRAYKYSRMHACRVVLGLFPYRTFAHAGFFVLRPRWPISMQVPLRGWLRARLRSKRVQSWHYCRLGVGLHFLVRVTPGLWWPGGLLARSLGGSLSPVACHVTAPLGLGWGPCCCL